MAFEDLPVIYVLTEKLDNINQSEILTSIDLFDLSYRSSFMFKTANAALASRMRSHFEDDC